MSVEKGIIYILKKSDVDEYYAKIGLL